MIPVFVPMRHAGHAPSLDYSDGLPPFRHLETASRVDAAQAGVAAALDVETREVEGAAEDLARAIHDADYVDFLRDICASLGSGEEYIPALFGDDLATAALPLRGGAFSREIGTPIGPDTYDAALNALAAARDAASWSAAHRRHAVALCRPPGHHAGRRRYGGYCFFNNAYGAARVLAAAGRSATVLDIDYHLGDGSMEFATAETPYYSIHLDPSENYPYLPADRGLDVADVVTTRALQAGCAIGDYLPVLEEMVGAINAASPDHLIVSAGFDLLDGDYIQDQEAAITAADFERIGAAVRAFDGPILFLFEGGYHETRLAAAVEAFFRAFR